MKYLVLSTVKKALVLSLILGSVGCVRSKSKARPKPRTNTVANKPVLEQTPPGATPSIESQTEEQKKAAAADAALALQEKKRLEADKNKKKDELKFQEQKTEEAARIAAAKVAQDESAKAETDRIAKEKVDADKKASDDNKEKSGDKGKISLSQSIEVAKGEGAGKETPQETDKKTGADISVPQDQGSVDGVKKIFEGKVAVTRDEDKLVKSDACSLSIVPVSDQASLLKVDLGGFVHEMFIYNSILNEKTIFDKEKIETFKKSIAAFGFNPAAISLIKFELDKEKNSITLKRMNTVVTEKNITKSQDKEEIKTYIQTNLNKIATDKNFDGLVRNADAITVVMNQENAVSGYSFSYRESIGGSGQEKSETVGDQTVKKIEYSYRKVIQVNCNAVAK